MDPDKPRDASDEREGGSSSSDFGICSVERTPDRLTIQGEVESIPPSWTRALLYGAGFLGLALGVAHLVYVFYVVGDPAGFGLDRRGFSNPENDTWFGVVLTSAFLGILVAGFVVTAIGLLIKSIPGGMRPLVYRLVLDAQTARVERLVDGEAVHRNELPISQVERVDGESANLGFGRIIVLTARDGRSLEFGKYLAKTSHQNEMSRGVEAEVMSLMGEINEFLSERR